MSSAVGATRLADPAGFVRASARYAYHHGYFDGVEREFRAFGMVEQFDTEEFAVLSATGALAEATNLDEASHVPPVLTKTWFHTGAYLEGAAISLHFAHEYWGAPASDDVDYDAKFRSFTETLLDDTVLPDGLTIEEEWEACRALKGSMLRQEVYALDSTDKAQHPYAITEQNFTIERLQPQAGNRYAVIFTHAREAISYHYERNPTDPRIAHTLTLEVDEFGNVQPDMTLSAEDQAKQAQIFVTYTENRVTNAIEGTDDYRTPLSCESRALMKLPV